MKPPPFEYHDPETLEEALDLLAEHGDDAKLLAGGQSLVPMLNFRLARPEVLVDLNRIDGLDGLTLGPDCLRIGALVRQRALERSDAADGGSPLLKQAIRYVAHPQIRNRGTVGGSAAHADPAAELPVVLVALEATFVARSKGSQRRVPADEFFISHLTTALADDEILVEIEVPTVPAGARSAFVEFARRHGDYGLGGAAAQLSFDGAGRCLNARLALLAASDTPVRPTEAENLLAQSELTPDLVKEVSHIATRDLNPVGDQHGDAEYRRQVIKACCERAIATAANDHARLEPGR